jgi:hypothetical protein
MTFADDRPADGASETTRIRAACCYGNLCLSCLVVMSLKMYRCRRHILGSIELLSWHCEAGHGPDVVRYFFVLALAVLMSSRCFLIISAKAGFVLASSRTSSTWMFLRPACLQYISICCQHKKFYKAQWYRLHELCSLRGTYLANASVSMATSRICSHTSSVSAPINWGDAFLL